MRSWYSGIPGELGNAGLVNFGTYTDAVGVCFGVLLMKCMNCFCCSSAPDSVESPTPGSIHHNGSHWRPAWGTVQQSEYQNSSLSFAVPNEEKISQILEVHVWMKECMINGGNSSWMKLHVQVVMAKV